MFLLVIAGAAFTENILDSQQKPPIIQIHIPLCTSVISVVIDSFQVFACVSLFAAGNCLCAFAVNICYSPVTVIVSLRSAACVLCSHKKIPCQTPIPGLPLLTGMLRLVCASA